MDPAETIVLPSPSAPPPRASLPLLAAVVPVVSGVVLFAVTRSPLSLCFAALGPVMILASFLDGLRQRRRALREARAEEAAAWQRAEEAVTARADAERQRRRRAAPDLAACLAEAPLRRSALAGDAEVTIGRGDGPSPLRFSGTGERADAFRARHGTISGVPVTAGLHAGVCVRGPAPLVHAVARAMVLQLCLRHAPGAIRLVGDGVALLGLAGLPQAGAHRPDATVVHVGAERTFSAGARVALVAPGAPPPPGYEAVIDVAEPAVAEIRSPHGVRTCAAEGISREQAAALVRVLAEGAATESTIPAAVSLQEALGAGAAARAEAGGAGEGRAGTGLAAALGRDAEGPVVVDLVADGPHALVTGVTGAGKSELLVSWVTAIAATGPAREAGFVLADFKGGTAFEPLRALPHVAAVITDLDAGGAARGVRSLRAELRRREEVLAAHGLRGIDEADGVLGRLVIVVDEFAALLQEHPDLTAVFTDIAARGRALGLHLILGTQRATGVVREALAANCPLRIALRVTDPADSRAMIGTDAAAGLPGDLAGRGLALVRRPQDGAPGLFRVARTSAQELAAVVEQAAGQERARSPWLPPLPLRVNRAALADPAGGGIVLGVADEPERQQQPIRTLRAGDDRGLVVVGGPGSGKSSVLRAVAEQVPGSLVLPPDPEQAWSIVDDLADGRRAMPALLAVDDLDRQLAAFPIEYAGAWAERLQRVIRMAGEHGGTVLLSAARCNGQVAALAELLPSRAVLRTSSRTEHLAAGGETSTFDPGRPPGRATLDGTELQFALPERAAAPAPATRNPLWQPRCALVGVVSTTPARTADALVARFGDRAVQLLADGAPAVPQEARRPSGDPVLSEAQRGRPELPGDGRDPMLLVGDAESWQRQYGLWQRIVRSGEVVVLAEAARELRTLAGVRELPPYAVPFAGRAWAIDRDGRPSRVILHGPPRA
ncbi:FtsK/SpoIIIE domain-containing protein [Microbacterium sp. 22242]|uniref:FtsK/SpoIIIE domain-containing protein n=1 Tax=Microbacterium sp. 22242 TaxID=3453896 RepID=UPI003F86E47B